MTTSGPKPPVSFLEAGDDVLARRVDRVGGTEALGPVELAVVPVDGDDRRRSGEHSPGDGGIADTAAADDGDRLPPLHRGGVDRGAPAGHHAAADEPGGGRVGVLVHLRALTGRDERLVGEGADAERR
jgi:hypothetical protein